MKIKVDYFLKALLVSESGCEDTCTTLPHCVHEQSIVQHSNGSVWLNAIFILAELKIHL